MNGETESSSFLLLSASRVQTAVQWNGQKKAEAQSGSTGPAARLLKFRTETCFSEIFILAVLKEEIYLIEIFILF